MFRDRFVQVDGLQLRVASELDRPGTPLLIFNGIGASAGILHPLVETLSVPVITFDLPGVGGSRAWLVPRRMCQFVRLARRLLRVLEIDHCHVMGISWGGALAQQFARQYPDLTRRLILVATSPGCVMVPPRPSVLLNMATPLHYASAGYFRKIAGRIYGDDFRNDAQLRERHARRMTPPSVLGYLGQLFAVVARQPELAAGEPLHGYHRLPVQQCHMPRTGMQQGFGRRGGGQQAYHSGIGFPEIRGRPAGFSGKAPHRAQRGEHGAGQGREQ